MAERIALKIFFFKFCLYCYFLAMLGLLHCCSDFSRVVANGGSSLAAECRLLVAVASLVVKHGL